jgi:hypothetical protein
MMGVKGLPLYSIPEVLTDTDCSMSADDERYDPTVVEGLLEEKEFWHPRNVYDRTTLDADLDAFLQSVKIGSKGHPFAPFYPSKKAYVIKVQDQILFDNLDADMCSNYKSFGFCNYGFLCRHRHSYPLDTSGWVENDATLICNPNKRVMLYKILSGQTDYVEMDSEVSVFESLRSFYGGVKDAISSDEEHYALSNEEYGEVMTHLTPANFLLRKIQSLESDLSGDSLMTILNKKLSVDDLKIVDYADNWNSSEGSIKVATIGWMTEIELETAALTAVKLNALGYNGPTFVVTTGTESSIHYRSLDGQVVMVSTVIGLLNFVHNAFKN